MPRTPTPPRTLLRYTAFQMPGVVIVGFVLALLHQQVGLPIWVAILIGSLWIAKDALLYPFVRRAYEPSDTAHDRLIGQRAQVVRGFAANGLVRVRGELWRAELLDGEPPVADGEVVTVTAARRLTLKVRRPVRPDGTTRPSGATPRPGPPSARSPATRGRA